MKHIASFLIPATLVFVVLILTWVHPLPEADRVIPGISSLVLAAAAGLAGAFWSLKRK